MTTIDHTTLIIVALIAATPGTLSAISSWRNGRKIENVSHAMNSMLDERVADAGTIGRAEGRESERQRSRGKSNKAPRHGKI